MLRDEGAEPHDLSVRKKPQPSCRMSRSAFGLPPPSSRAGGRPVRRAADRCRKRRDRHPTTPSSSAVGRSPPGRGHAQACGRDPALRHQPHRLDLELAAEILNHLHSIFVSTKTAAGQSPHPGRSAERRLTAPYCPEPEKKRMRCPRLKVAASAERSDTSSHGRACSRDGAATAPRARRTVVVPLIWPCGGLGHREPRRPNHIRATAGAAARLRCAGPHRSARARGRGAGVPRRPGLVPPSSWLQPQHPYMVLVAEAAAGGRPAPLSSRQSRRPRRHIDAPGHDSVFGPLVSSELKAAAVAHAR